MHSANQACTARLDARAPKVTVLQLPMAQCRALRCAQCQLLIIYYPRLHKKNDQSRKGDGATRRAYNERSALPPILGGNDDPICALRTRVREMRASRVFGRAPSAVFSRCSEVSVVKAPKVVGNEPATNSQSKHHRLNKRSCKAMPGEFPSPIISRDSSAVRFVNCSGRDAGTAGKVSCLRRGKDRHN
jgi:hypothetical protein